MEGLEKIAFDSAFRFRLTEMEQNLQPPDVFPGSASSRTPLQELTVLPQTPQAGFKVEEDLKKAKINSESTHRVHVSLTRFNLHQIKVPLKGLSSRATDLVLCEIFSSSFSVSTS